VQQFSNPCCLCAPLLGQTLVEQGCQVTILDIDRRFASLPGFQRYDIYRSIWLEEEFDLIVCDPPFFNISLSQLLSTVRKLAHYNDNQALLISYLHRRANKIVGTFSPFKLVATGYFPSYQTVQAVERNKIEFFSNLDDAYIAQLRLQQYGE
jgi:hypothetical protein